MDGWRRSDRYAPMSTTYWLARRAATSSRAHRWS